MPAQADAVWKALADPTRREMLDLMRLKPRTTGDLSAAFPDVTRYAVMKHLKVLEGADLVRVRREGRVRWNIHHAAPLEMVLQPWVQRHIGMWKQNLENLKDYVEDNGLD